MIEPQVFPDHESLSRHAADWIFQRVRERPNSIVSLAAGSTPGRTYELLAERGQAEPDAVAQCRWLKLDEWGSLAMDDPATCEHQLRTTLIEPLRAGGRYTAFESQAADPAAECVRIAGWLAGNGPIDVCVLGLGTNGHLGFNEPADFLSPRAHVARLAESSLTHAMLKQTSGRPKYGVTLGIADLLHAREILILVSGASKQVPLERLLARKVTTQFPASLLHLHPKVTLLADAAAMPGSANSSA